MEKAIQQEVYRNEEAGYMNSEGLEAMIAIQVDTMLCYTWKWCNYSIHPILYEPIQKDLIAIITIKNYYCIGSQHQHKPWSYSLNDQNYDQALEKGDLKKI